MPDEPDEPTRVHVRTAKPPPQPPARVVVGHGAPATSPPVDLAGLRQHAGLTQAQLAARLGISQAAVQKLERQPDPKLSTLRRFAEALDGGGLEVRVALPRRGWMVLQLPAGN